MLPKTVNDIVNQVDLHPYADALRDGVDYIRIVTTVLEAAGIKIADDGKTLIYPSTQGTDTPRYQIQEQRNIRSRGARRRR